MILKKIFEKIKSITLNQILFFIGVLILTIVIIISLYFLNFGNSEISKNSTILGAYGSYISGVTSILNLIVFIYLSVYVAQLGNSNNKKQLETQKKIILAQFRQNELLKWKEKINKQFDEVDIADIEKFKNELTNLKYNLNTFSDHMRKLFPAIQNIENININEGISDNIEIIYKVLVKYELFGVIYEDETNTLEFSFRRILDSKYEFFNNLQEAILADLE